MLDWLILAGGFVILVLAAGKLVDGASSIATRLGVSDIVIGLTIVAFGTSAPELVVNTFASIEKNSGLVLGNVMGSNIFNVLLILGVCAVIYPLTVKRNTHWLEIPLSFLAAVSVLFVSNDIFFDSEPSNFISRSDGLVFILFFAIFLVYNFEIAKKDNATDGDEVIDKKNYSPLKSIIFIIIGIAGLSLGGKLIVSSAVNIATLFGLSERIIGLTIVSIGTSLPELATSVMAVRKKNVSIAIGNVVGSNIFNIFFILGLSAIINPVDIIPATLSDQFMNVLSGFLLFLFLFTGKRKTLDRWEGVLFLIIYVAYVVMLILDIQPLNFLF